MSSPVENSSCITRPSHPKTGTRKGFLWKDAASPSFPHSQASPLGRWKWGHPLVQRAAPSFRIAKLTLVGGEGQGHWPQSPSHWPGGGLSVQTKKMGGIWSLGIATSYECWHSLRCHININDSKYPRHPQIQSCRGSLLLPPVTFGKWQTSIRQILRANLIPFCGQGCP